MFYTVEVGRGVIVFRLPASTVFLRKRKVVICDDRSMQSNWLEKSMHYLPPYCQHSKSLSETMLLLLNHFVIMTVRETSRI